MPNVEIITIGTELLLGDVPDTNSSFIARNLKNSGYDLFRLSTIGDNQNRIAQIMLEALSRSDIVITTGGLGPTVDDPTREAVAQAFNVILEFHQGLWDQISSRFQSRGLVPTENNRKQALLPAGAIPIENKYGTAPAFIFPVNNKYLICLPGVPQEMERLLLEQVLPFMFQNIRPHHQMVSRTLHTIGIGESALDAIVHEFEKMNNPTVGLLAHAGIVDIRLVAASESKESALAMVSELESQIRNLIPENIFGIDDEEISDVIAEMARIIPQTIMIELVGFPTEFDYKNSELTIETLAHSKAIGTINSGVRLGFQYGVSPLNDQKSIIIKLPGQSKIIRTFMGPDSSFMSWATNTISYHIWSFLKKIILMDKK